jgi:hypothetical protein
MISNNKISNLVASQVPFFVRNDHENFVAFVEAYYEFLEQQTGVVNVSKSLLDQSDVDLTDIFVEKFYDNFLPFIPKDTAVDKTLILKHIKDFYRSRGTEKSIRFLMRVLFDEDVEFYYPQRDVLKVSDGKWFQEKSIKITDIEVDGVANSSLGIETKFINRRITGNVSNAYALIERTSSYYEGNSLVRELKLSNQYRDFSYGEKITSTFFEGTTEKTITANLFSGGINTVEIINGGTRYIKNQVIPIESATGTGAEIIVSSVSSGDLTAIAALNGGAGFQVGNQVLITGGSGSGANANVSAVSADSFYHPNSYNIVSSTIALEAGTPINNLTYSNLNSSISNPVNHWISNSMSYFVYANTGPITGVLLYNLGSGYSTTPSISAQANTRVRNLGILGKMRIVDGGTGYYIGDTIEFINVPGGTGSGAAARVANVDVSQGNAISKVEFVNVRGQITGGSGYEQLLLPIANVVSSNAQASNANIQVTAVLGSGETLYSANSVEGRILSLQILKSGSGYTTPPVLNFTQIGDGTAQAVTTIITGAFTYPGRYLNDDGHISSYNFIQDRDYYQKFSYVVKVQQSIDKYRSVLKNLIHPAGMKLFGEYSTVDEGAILNIPIRGTSDNLVSTTAKTYRFETGNVYINYTDHGLNVGNTVYLEWLTGNLSPSNIATAVAANVINVPYDSVAGSYKIKTVVNTNQFIINTVPYIANTNTDILLVDLPTYLANTLLPNTSGTVNVGKVIY